jgi:DNA polymerase III delta prime subunit
MIPNASAAMIAAPLATLMSRFEPGCPAGRVLSTWLRDNQILTGIDLDRAGKSAGLEKTVRTTRTDRPLTKALWGAAGEAFRAIAATEPADDPIARNIVTLCTAVGLDATESAIFRFVFATCREKLFDELCASLLATRTLDATGLIALAIGEPSADVAGKLRRGTLHRLHLVNLGTDGPTHFAPYVPYRIIQALLPPNDGLADIERALIGAPRRPGLEMEDFDHVAAERDFLVRLLAGAVETGRAGVNILIHGRPGTGKTAFCETVAAGIGCDLFAIGEADEDGDEPSRATRIEALRLADQLAGGRKGAILLFDEMEDLLQHGERSGTTRRAGSKVFFNRLLETNRVPVLWTANAVDEFDPAFLRRMSFAFEMKPLPAPARARLWHGLAQAQGLDLALDDATALSRRHLVAPSVIKGAAEAVALAKGQAGELDFVVGALAKPLGAPRIATAQVARFVPELAHCDFDIGALEQALRRPDAARDVALCLHGPPGTGKSAFARHLAAAMGLDVLEKRGSDLLSKWLGETEKRIAAAFREAREDGRFLIVDEADSLLWSRDGAQHSWEASMVNELLRAMEDHPLPFACTTNQLDRIDAAALRRFALKIGFDFMTPAQAALAYRRFFDRAAPAALAEINGLTAGDFAVAAKKRSLLGAAESDAAIIDWLASEVAVKRMPARRIGFAT